MVLMPCSPSWISGEQPARVFLLILSLFFLLEELSVSMSSSRSLFQPRSRHTDIPCLLSAAKAVRVLESPSGDPEVQTFFGPTLVQVLSSTREDAVGDETRTEPTLSQGRRRRVGQAVGPPTDQPDGARAGARESGRTKTGEEEASFTDPANQPLPTGDNEELSAATDPERNQPEGVVRLSSDDSPSSAFPQDLQSAAFPALSRASSNDPRVKGGLPNEAESRVPPHTASHGASFAGQRWNGTSSVERALWESYVKRRGKAIRREAAWKIAQLSLTLVLQIMDMYVFLHQKYYDPVVKKLSGGANTRGYVLFRFFNNPLVFLYFLYGNISLLVDTWSWMYVNGFIGPGSRRGDRRVRTKRPQLNRHGSREWNHLDNRADRADE